ncbi:MAG TPA: oligosaccharide flippase family protein [Nocardioidaceae bacterium]|nr:oligosaccharide flippase family protein [Nocardioidaceae bacterium]
MSNGARPKALSADATDSLGRHAVSGAAWGFLQKWGGRVGSLVTLAILTRHLSPADFGIVAAATAYLPLLNLLADGGFSSYVLQATKVDQRVLSTAFWMNALMGLGLAAVTVAAAPLLQMVLGVEDFAIMLQALAPAVIFSAITGTPAALLRRRLAFRAYAARHLFAAMASQVVAVVLVLSGAGVWALIAQFVTHSFVACITVWIAARWMPSRMFSRRQAAVMAAYGVRVVGADVIGVMRGWLENMILVSVVGPTGLGYWNIATRLAQVATDMTATTVVFVSSSVFARIKTDSERLAKAYLRAQSTVAAIAGLVMLALAVLSPLLLPLFFGPGWEPSIPLAQLYALANLFVLGAMLDRGLFLGTGRPGRWLGYAVATDATSVLGTAVAAPHGITAVAVTFLVVAVVATVARVFLVAGTVGIPISAPALSTTRLLAVGAFAALPTWGVMTVLADHAPAPLVLLAAGATMVVTWLLLLRLVAPSVVSEVWLLSPKRLRKRAPRSVRWLLAPG